VEAEIVDDKPRGRTLGLLGAFLALLTMGAAFGVGLLMLFGRFLVAAAVVWAAWPVVFTPEFTQWAFGAPQLSFWKVFLTLAATGTVVKLLWRQSWPKR
jgi:hypothetical protein